MKEFSVKRILTIAGAGIMKVGEGLMSDGEFFPAGLQNVSKDHFNAFKELEKSEVDYTVICVPHVKEGGNGDTVIGVDDYPENAGMDVFVQDIASFIVKEARDNNYVHKKISLSNKKKAE